MAVSVGNIGWIKDSTSTATSCPYDYFSTANTIKQWTQIAYKANPAGTYSLSDCEEEWYGGMMSRKLVPGVEYDLPDGAKIKLEVGGNYRIEDKDAKVTYKANRLREFSPHLNASDMVAKFIEFVGGLGVQKRDMLDLPLQLFINWLVIEAAERDSDPLPADVVQVAQHPALKAVVAPKCLACGRFIPRLNFRHGFPFCSPEHGAVYVERKRPMTIHQPQAVLAIAQ